MSLTVADAVHAAERLWPKTGAEDWDAPGLQVGRLANPLSRVLLVVDVVAQTVAEAVSGKYDLVVAHHPLLLSGVTSVAEDSYKGALIGELIRNDIALLVAHTNADVVVDGVSDVLAQSLGLIKTTPIEPTVSASIGLGRVGELAQPTTLGQLATDMARVLPATATGVQVAGDFGKKVQRIALCGGAGDSFLEHALVRGADVYITSDLRHHRASESLESAAVSGGPALINISHWASEWLWLTPAAKQLRSLLAGVTVDVCDVRTDPWDFVVTQ